MFFVVSLRSFFLFFGFFSFGIVTATATIDISFDRAVFELSFDIGTGASRWREHVVCREGSARGAVEFGCDTVARADIAR